MRPLRSSSVENTTKNPNHSSPCSCFLSVRKLLVAQLTSNVNVMFICFTLCDQWKITAVIELSAVCSHVTKTSLTVAFDTVCLLLGTAAGWLETTPRPCATRADRAELMQHPPDKIWVHFQSASTPRLTMTTAVLVWNFVCCIIKKGLNQIWRRIEFLFYLWKRDGELLWHSTSLNCACPSSNLPGCLPFSPTASRLISLIGTGLVVI